MGRRLPVRADRYTGTGRAIPIAAGPCCAKSEMEGVMVTDVIRDALEAYAATAPGSKVTYQPPKRR
jgi:hypothetical protein